MTAQTILPANSVTGGYDVENSLRFNAGTPDYLARTQGTPTSDKIGTISFWLKRSKLGNKRILVNRNDSNIWFFLDFRSDDKLRFATNNESDSDLNLELSCNRVFRDTAAWYHIVYKIDTTQATAGNRAKLYVNGVEETSFLTSTIPAQNTPCYSFVSSVSNGHAIGAYYNGSAYSEHMDGYFAEFCYIDGTALGPDSFGEFDDSGIWKPIDGLADLTFGDNGYYLEFKGTGTSADSSGMGADTSGEGNHFAASGLTAVDRSTDTCTNNFATLNPLYLSAASLNFADGNLTNNGVTSNADRSEYGTIGLSTGKWYFETLIVKTNTSDSNNLRTGIVDVEQVVHTANNGTFFTSSRGYAYYGQDGTKRNNGQSGAYGNSFTKDDIIGCAFDLDNNKIYWSKNGTFQNSGDPTTGSTGTGSAYNLASGYTYLPAFSQYYDDDRLSINFGSPPYAISSGNADANGHGNFEYAVPSGYFAICSKNLAEHG